MLEVFKTDIQDTADALLIQQQLYRYFPDCRIVFDLEDCDKILKITGGNFAADTVQKLVHASGFFLRAIGVKHVTGKENSDTHQLSVKCFVNRK